MLKFFKRVSVMVDMIITFLLEKRKPSFSGMLLSLDQLFVIKTGNLPKSKLQCIRTLSEVCFMEELELYSPEIIFESIEEVNDIPQKFVIYKLYDVSDSIFLRVEFNIAPPYTYVGMPNNSPVDEPNLNLLITSNSYAHLRRIKDGHSYIRSITFVSSGNLESLKQQVSSLLNVSQLIEISPESLEAALEEQKNRTDLITEV